MENKTRQLFNGEHFSPGKKYIITEESYKAIETDYELNKDWINKCSNTIFTVEDNSNYAFINVKCKSTGVIFKFTVIPKWCCEVLD